MSNLKSYKLDLGGNFPAKSEAVRSHGVYLGYEKDSTLGSARYLFFGGAGTIGWSNHTEFFETYECEQITAEKFLELTKDDVIEKPKTEKAWRYIVLDEDGDWRVSSFFAVKRGSLYYTTGGDASDLLNDALELKKHMGIEVPYVEIKE